MIHFHACSLGETRALAPLVKEFPKVNISTITPTGYTMAKSFKNATVRYLPFEPLLWYWLTPQKALVVVEAELWYLLFYLSKKRGAKTYLINARISEKSFPRYKKFRWLYKKVFENIDKIFAQSPKDKEYLEALGAKNVEIIGNIKLLNKPTVTKTYPKPRKIILAASTHEPEEELIATAWLDTQKGKSTLVIAPRHPERFEEVDELLKEIAQREGLTYSKLSQDSSFESDLVLVDQLGELNNIYAISDLAILGGSFTPNVGGHNPLEPAFFNVPIVSGPHYFNQVPSYSAVEGIEIILPQELTQLLERESFKKSKIISQASLEPVLEELKSVV